MGVPTVSTAPMTVEEFYAFTDARPDEEKWALIDGEPVLNAAPSPLHQCIFKNLTFALTAREREADTSWVMLPGLGVRGSDSTRPEPGVLILPRSGDSRDPSTRERGDAIAVFEILSPSTTDRDLRWKHAAYTSMPSLTHYVVVAQDAVEVVVFARETGFAEQRFRSLDANIAIQSLGISLPLAEVYRDTGL